MHVPAAATDTAIPVAVPLAQRRHVVMFSAGGGSWMTARRVAERHGTGNLHLLFTDTLYESPDTYVFLIQAAADIYGIALPEGLVPALSDFPNFRDRPAFRSFLKDLRERVAPHIPNLSWIADGRDIWQVFFDERFLANSGIDPCSKILKRLTSYKWLEDNCDPANTTVYVGIDWTEAHRFDDRQGGGVGPRRKADGWDYEAPLVEPPYVSKPFIIEQMRLRGLDVPTAYLLGFSHNNCFASETRFITDEGAKSLGEMAGKTCNVLGKGGKLRAATIESFGVQPLMRLHLRRRNRVKTVYVTAGHRWFAYAGDRSNVRKELTTDQLKPGTKLVGMFGQGIEHHIKLSAFGIAHGIAFGDGSMNDAVKLGYTNPGHVILCGEKDAQLAKWFPLSPQTPCEAGIKVSDLPRHFKERPKLTESKSYLAGWLAGYIAADGSVSSDGTVKLHSAKYDVLQFVRDVCYRLGVGTTGISTAHRSGFGGEKTAIHTICFFRHTLREDMFLIDEHKERAVAAGFERSRETDTWMVDLVEPSDRVEEVFCAVVPEHAMFTLEDNILTGNCHKGCVKAGHEHWLNLLRKDRELYLYYEELEQEFRDYLGADVSILTDRAGDNKKKVLTLRIFRTRFEETKQLGFLFEEEFAGAFKEGLGGCGCMIETDGEARPTKVEWSSEDDARLASLVMEMGLGDNALKAIASKMGCGLGGLRARLTHLGVDFEEHDAQAAGGILGAVGKPRRGRKKAVRVSEPA